jgi:transmembrane sensor
VAAEPAPPSEPVVVAAAAPLARRAAPDRDADLDRTLARVDGLRRSGELSEAADLLDRAAQAHRDDPRLPTALFTLGRVQRARGLHGDAARAFRRCWQLAPAGPLAPDAHAQEARAWAAAQDREAAEQAARAYLRLAPRGPHADAMKRLLE